MAKSRQVWHPYTLPCVTPCLMTLWIDVILSTKCQFDLMLSATPELFHRELFDLLWLPFRMIACQFACKCLVHIKLPVAINSHGLVVVSVIRGNVDYSCKLVKCFWCVLFMDDLWMSKSKNYNTMYRDVVLCCNVLAGFLFTV